MNWTKSQESAINMRGKNILVAAAAGSGKTAVLVSRIQKLVIEEKESIDRMLIVTFTNAAASEMRQKIEDALRSSIYADEDKNLLFIKQQLDILPSANISTFHAFSLEVIHRYFYLTDVEPNFKICDDVRATLLKEDAMNELMETLYEENDPIFYSFLDKYSGERNDQKFRELISKVYETVESMPNPKEWLNGACREVEERFIKDAAFLEYSVNKYDEIYLKLKKKKGLLDFSDIEHIAFKILENEEAQKYYREKFNHIFIDEYQDSNIIQEELIKKIARDNNLFMVGDVKQSIYKFRLAEPENCERRYKAYSEGDPNSAKIDLNQNFRSKKPVIDFINYIFRSLMDGYDDNAELKLGAKNGEDSPYEPKLYLTEVPWDAESEIDEELKNLKKAEKEALACVKIINDYLGKPFFDDGELRPLRRRDIVILMRGVKGYGDIFYRVLMENSLPCFVDDSEGYFDTIEINTMLSLLRIIDNEKQDIPLLSVLRSDIFGFSISELAEIRIHHKEGTYFDALNAYQKSGEGVGTESSEHENSCENPALRDKVNNVFASLRKWQEDAKNLRLDELIWNLELETGFYIYAGALPGGSLRQANLRALVDRAISYSKNQGGSLYGFIRYIDAVKEKKVASPQVKLLGEDEDVVRIMTIHKSKGLEFPMVILAGYAKKLNYTKVGKSVLIHKDAGLGFPDVSYEEKWIQTTDKQTEIKDRIKEEEAAEEKRILYVAMTRAKDILCLLGIVNNVDDELKNLSEKDAKETSYLSMTGGYIIDKNAVIVIGDKELNDVKRTRKRSVKSALSYVDEPAKDISPEILNKMSFAYPYEKELGIKSKYSVSELNEDALKGLSKAQVRASGLTQGLAIDANDALSSRSERLGFSASEIGTFTHTALEHMDFNLARKEEMSYLDKLIEGLYADEILLKEEAEAINKKKLLEFAKSDLGERIGKAAEKGLLFREKPFNLITTVDSVETIVQGIIDCYFEEDGKYVLVDYKTTNPNFIDGVRERYQKQIDLYRDAIFKASGKEVKEAYLYLTNVGKQIEM